jgi:Domain of unknown function (DUF2019)
MTAHPSKLRSLSSQELADLFTAAAIARTGAINELKPKVGNRHFDMMTDIYLELKSRGIDAQRMLLPLIGHADPDVRFNAAALALEFAPALAEPVLESLKQLHGFVGYEAKLTLEMWAEGELEFPPYVHATDDQ